MTEGGYRAMTTFFRQAREHLAPSGRMLIFFGTSGDLGYLQRLLDETGFSSEVGAHDELTRDGWRVDHFWDPRDLQPRIWDIPERLPSSVAARSIGRYWLPRLG
jgi:hypothetical protein